MPPSNTAPSRWSKTSRKIFADIALTAGVISLGLAMKQLPAATIGTTGWNISRKGKFHGANSRQTPRGS